MQKATNMQIARRVPRDFYTLLHPTPPNFVLDAMSLDAKAKEQLVQNSLAKLRDTPGLSITDATRATGASYWQVYRRHHGYPPSSSRGGHNKKMTVPQDAALIDHIYMCWALGKSATLDIVIASANSILRCSGAQETVSRRWAKSWLSRHSDELKALRSKPLSIERRGSHIREEIEAHFADFARCRSKWGIQDDDIYNFDETGCQIGITSGSLVIVPAGESAAFADDPDNRELVTAIECISATGYHLPAMLILRELIICGNTLTMILMAMFFFARSESGFSNDKLALKWLYHFDKFTAKRTKGKYRMLIFDGHGSHITQDFIDYCWEHHIRPFQLPPHSTHLLQPLDVGGFQCYKYNFRKCLDEQIFLGTTDVAKDDFFAIFQHFSDRTFKGQIAQSAFKKTGLIPYQPSVVLDKLDSYGALDTQERTSTPDEEADDSPAFATPPPPAIDWSNFDTPITHTQRRRGALYITSRAQLGALTPTAIRVMEKVESATERMLLKGQLATELLQAQNNAQSRRQARKQKGGKII
jgi:hypothetical protein